jgi:hypothetical protein
MRGCLRVCGSVFRLWVRVCVDVRGHVHACVSVCQCACVRVWVCFYLCVRCSERRTAVARHQVRRVGDRKLHMDGTT